METLREKRVAQFREEADDTAKAAAVADGWQYLRPEGYSWSLIEDQRALPLGSSFTDEERELGVAVRDLGPEQREFRYVAMLIDVPERFDFTVGTGESAQDAVRELRGYVTSGGGISSARQLRPSEIAALGRTSEARRDDEVRRLTRSALSRYYDRRAWRVRVVEAGRDASGEIWSESAIAAVAEHLKRGTPIRMQEHGGHPSDQNARHGICGYLFEPRRVGDAVLGVAQFMAEHARVHEALLSAYVDEELHRRYGLSIDATVLVEPRLVLRPDAFGGRARVSEGFRPVIVDVARVAAIDIVDRPMMASCRFLEPLLR